MEMPTPDARILGLKSRLVARLREVLPHDAVIDDEMQTRVYECDALTAYKCPPLCAVLPASTEEVSAVLKICHQEGVPVVPRGSGTSLAGGALPTADSVILGVARLNDVLETDYDNRFIKVQTGRTNLSVTGAVESDGFFYAPDPSSQLACAIAGNIAMNSGGAHCLKYGVTTNNLLGVTMVQMDGTVVEIGGAHMDSAGYDWLGLICGSEGQLGVVTEAILRILPKPEGARPVLIGYKSAEIAGACVSDIIKAGVLPVAIEYMDRKVIEVVENYAKAGYPDCEALLIVEVEGSPAEIDEQLGLIKQIAAKHDPVELREAQDAEEAGRI
ncbi:MAG: FAD-binding protein, partial [Altererythrobacter sp.]|nr:FAD-binding protein [Altererythrobacter sp.]